MDKKEEIIEEKKENNENNNNDEKKEMEQANQILDSYRRITNNDVKDSSTLLLEEAEGNIFNGK